MAGRMTTGGNGIKDPVTGQVQWRDDPVYKHPQANWQTLDRYTQRLRQALYSVGYLRDPDFSLSQDPDAIEKLMRDPVVNFAVNFRKRLVAGREWFLEPIEEEYKRYVPVFQDLLSRTQRFAQSRFILAEAIFQGVAIARIDGHIDYHQLKGTRGWRKWWYPRRLVPIDKRRLRKEYVRYPDNQHRMKFKYVWTIFDPEAAQWFVIDKPDWYFWFLYNDEEDRLGYGKGLYDALFLPWYAKTNAMQYGLAWLERFAEPWILAEIDAEVGDTDQFTERATNYINLLKQMRGGRTFVYDKRDKVSLAEAGTGSQGIVKDFVSLLNEDIIRVCLSNTLTTGTGQHGSRAQAEVHENSQESAINYDRMVFQEEHDNHYLKPTWKHNRANLFSLGFRNVPWECPLRFRLQQEQKWEAREQMDVFKTARELGVATKVEEFRTRLGLSAPSADDEIIEPASPQQAMPGGMFAAADKWLAGKRKQFAMPKGYEKLQREIGSRPLHAMDAYKAMYDALSEAPKEEVYQRQYGEQVPFILRHRELLKTLGQEARLLGLKVTESVVADTGSAYMTVLGADGIACQFRISEHTPEQRKTGDWPENDAQHFYIKSFDDETLLQARQRLQDMAGELE